MKITCKIVLLLLVSIGLLSCKHSENSPVFYENKTGPFLLEGVVLNIPSRGSLELALFALDAQNRPKELLAVEHYKGDGNVLNFQVKFDVINAKPFSALEIRGRVTEAGLLVGYLVPWYGQRLTEHDLKGIVLELASDQT